MIIYEIFFIPYLVATSTSLTSGTLKLKIKLRRSERVHSKSESSEEWLPEKNQKKPEKNPVKSKPPPAKKSRGRPPKATAPSSSTSSGLDIDYLVKRPSELLSKIENIDSPDILKDVIKGQAAEITRLRLAVRNRTEIRAPQNPETRKVYGSLQGDNYKRNVCNECEGCKAETCEKAGRKIWCKPCQNKHWNNKCTYRKCLDPPNKR